ncbi:hypothetical protein PTKIN_Ptkin02bG0192600 [Pterospermum kingtungense]
MAPREKKPVIVRQVLAPDLRQEFEIIRHVVTQFPFVSMDTEFPGTVFKQDKQMVKKANPGVNYQFMKSNVDELKIIQLGLTFSDSEGNLPDLGTPFCYVWEFNFSDFDVKKDYCDKGSIELLKRQGIDFSKNKKMGIDSKDFTKMIWRFGLFSYFRKMTWITFHGAYDFGYLMKILTRRPLPCNLQAFMEELVVLFGHRVFDIKHTLKFLDLHGGLEKVAKTLNVARFAGSSHQAGSDSLLTLQCFMELKPMAFGRNPYMPSKIMPALALYGLVPDKDHFSCSRTLPSRSRQIFPYQFWGFPVVHENVLFLAVV